MTNFDKNICSLLKSMHFYVHDIVFVTMNSLCKSLRVRRLLFITGGKVKLSIIIANQQNILVNYTEIIWAMHFYVHDMHLSCMQKTIKAIHLHSSSSL